MPYLSNDTAFSRLPGGQRITLAGKRREKKEVEMGIIGVKLVVERPRYYLFEDEKGNHYIMYKDGCPIGEKTAPAAGCHGDPEKGIPMCVHWNPDEGDCPLAEYISDEENFVQYRGYLFAKKIDKPIKKEEKNEK